MMHHFDVEVARLYGINAAILLNNIAFWVVKNEANEENYHDGYYWTFNSIPAFNKLFPYLTEKQIRAALNILRSEELILTGNYNDDRRDRTLWYTLSEKGRCICLVGQMETPSVADVSALQGKSHSNNIYILNTTTDSKPDINADTEAQKATDETFEEFWAAYPRKDGKKVARQKWNRLKPDEEMRKKILADIERRKRSPEWLKENGQFIPMPSTYLNQQRWDDEGVTLSEPEAKYNFIN
jgi:hypothetical protein